MPIVRQETLPVGEILDRAQPADYESSSTDRFADLMQTGDWIDTNDPILIRTDGIVIVGQQRMTAAQRFYWPDVPEAEQPRFLVLWYERPAETQEAIRDWHANVTPELERLWATVPPELRRLR